MGLKLYDCVYSTNGRKVQMCIRELGIDVEQHEIDLMAGANRTPEFMKLNPNAKVPVLEDDGFRLFESSAIMRYLCEKKPEKGLFPREPKLRAEVDQWVAWDATHFGFESLFPLYQERVFRPMMKAPRRDQIEAAAHENFLRFAAVLNGACEGKQYLVGNALTLADIAIAGTLMYRDVAKVDLSPYPHLNAYARRIEERDSYKKTAPPPVG